MTPQQDLEYLPVANTSFSMPMATWQAQNLDLTGGTFYLDTKLGYMHSFGSNPDRKVYQVSPLFGISATRTRGKKPFSLGTGNNLNR